MQQKFKKILKNFHTKNRRKYLQHKWQGVKDLNNLTDLRAFFKMGNKYRKTSHGKTKSLFSWKNDWRIAISIVEKNVKTFLYAVVGNEINEPLKDKIIVFIKMLKVHPFLTQ